jgi:phosphohistidine swiveling domain-containing protein
MKAGKDYSRMTVRELEAEVSKILKKQHRQDDLFRFAVFMGQMDIARHIYNDRKHVPDGRLSGQRAVETASYGQALIQLLLLMRSRKIDFNEAFGYAIEHMQDDDWKEKKPKDMESVKGIPISGGVVRGTAYVVSEDSPIEMAPKGSIIIMEHAKAEIYDHLSRVKAVVTDQGGKLCHLAIVARELKLPSIVGTGNATRLIRTGDRITVDADSGTVKKSS